MTNYIVVERKLTINASTEQLQSWVIDFHKWVDWSPWEDIDPELKRTYSGPDAGVGASYDWSGNRKAGAGNMTIRSISGTAIDIDLTFTKPFKSQSKTHFDFQPNGTGTTVLWQVLTPKTSMLKIMSIFMKLDKTVGPDLEKGLAKLKSVTESGGDQS